MSASITRVPISKLKVKGRFRREPSDVYALAKSLKEVGLLHPIGITPEYEVLYGVQRLEAAKKLGWKEIDAQIIEVKDEFKKKLVELEENLKRTNLSWADEVRGKAELDGLYRKIYGEAKAGRPSEEKRSKVDQLSAWSYQKTAEVLGESKSTVVQDIQLAHGLEEHPELIQETSKVAAFKRLKALEKPVRITKEEEPVVVKRECELESLAFGVLEKIKMSREVSAKCDECELKDQCKALRGAFIKLG